jgi:hypothetical protein
MRSSSPAPRPGPRPARLAAIGLAGLLGACAQFVDDPHIIDAGGFPDLRRMVGPPTAAPTAAPTAGGDADAFEASTPPEDAGPAPDDARSPFEPDPPDVAALPTEPPPSTDYDFCVAETNRYRAQLGRAPVARSQAIEAYATEGAQEDHQAQSPHGHFQRTGGGGVSHAENACPGWLGWSVQGSVQATIANCLAAFFSEGPGGGHYENMIGAHGTVGCGWYIDANQSITIIQDFGP